MKFNRVRKWTSLLIACVIGFFAFDAAAQVGTNKIKNNYGSTVNKYECVFVDSAADSSFKEVTTSRAGGFIGVVYDTTITTGSYGNIIIAGNYATIAVTGTVTRGDYLVSSTTAGKAASGGTTDATGAFGVALQTGTNTNIAAILIAPAVFSSSTSATLSSLAVNTITVASGTTATLFNATATTVNAFGAATTIGLGASTGTLTVNNPTVVGSQTTQNLWNTVATTINFGGAAAINMSAAGKTTAVAGALTVAQTSTFTGALTGVQLNGRSLYLSNGSELITNGTFDTVTTPWLSSGSSLSIDTAHLRVTWVSGNAWAGQCVTGLTVGKRYKMTYQYIGGTAGSSYAIYIGTATSLIGTGYSAYAGVFAPAASLVTYYFTATSTNFSVAFGSYLGSAAYTDWDNISLVEIGDVSAAGTVFGAHVGCAPSSGAVSIPYGTILASGYGVGYLINSNSSGTPIALYLDADTFYFQKGGVALLTLSNAGLGTFTGGVAVNSSTGITTNQTTFPLLNTTATTINFGGAATTFNFGAATCASTLNGFTTAYDPNTSNSVTQPLKISHAGDGNWGAGASLGLYTSGAEFARIAGVNDVAAGGSMRFYVRVSGSVTEKARLYANGQFAVTQLALFALNTAPSSAADTGTLGEIRWDASYMYVCTATNTWKRAAIATW